MAARGHGGGGRARHQPADPPDGSTHWSTRTLGEYVGIGKDSVARIWQDHEIKPWQVKTFKVSNDPRFEEKLVDVVGLYHEPPQTGGGVQLRREDPGARRWIAPNRRCP